MVVQGVPAWYRRVAAEGVIDGGDAGRLVLAVSTKRLVELLDPLHADPWSVGPVTGEQVETALREGRLRARNPCWEETPGETANSDGHAERIAFLVHYGWDTTTACLQLEVDEYGGVGLHDGHHRLYALEFLGIEGPVWIELIGFLDVAETLFGIKIP